MSTALPPRRGVRPGAAMAALLAGLACMLASLSLLTWALTPLVGWTVRALAR